jgi:hypothetical protein
VFGVFFEERIAFFLGLRNLLRGISRRMPKTPSDTPGRVLAIAVIVTEDKSVSAIPTYRWADRVQHGCTSYIYGA